MSRPFPAPQHNPGRQMRPWWTYLVLWGLIVCWSSVLSISYPAHASEKRFPGVESPGRAQTNYALNCQGCHGAKAAGLPGSVPGMQNFVARFLSVKGGRDYLIRVPGMANAALPDDELAELANWVLATFDLAHMSVDFTPYTVAEVGRLRRQPFIADAARHRAALVRAMKQTSGQ